MVQKSKHCENVCIENFHSHPCRVHFPSSPNLVPTEYTFQLPTTVLVYVLCPSELSVTPSFMLKSIPVYMINDLFP